MVFMAFYASQMRMLQNSGKEVITLKDSIGILDLQLYRKIRLFSKIQQKTLTYFSKFHFLLIHYENKQNIRINIQMTLIAQTYVH